MTSPSTSAGRQPPQETWSLSIGGLRDSALGERSRPLELARDAAAEISRTLGHDRTAAG